MKRIGVAVALAGIALLLFPGVAHAWTPGTHIFLGESVLANLYQLPTLIADLLRAFPYDFLYGNIAADTSMAKKYAPVGRHCHAWHVGQEILDLAPSDPLRAFGLGYLSHLAADTIAHNFFVPRQLVLTSSTVALGHSYWESRFETHLGDAYAREARDVILKDHAASDAHLDEILSPTLFSVRTNRRRRWAPTPVTRRLGGSTRREKKRWAWRSGCGGKRSAKAGGTSPSAWKKRHSSISACRPRRSTTGSSRARSVPGGQARRERGTRGRRVSLRARAGPASDPPSPSTRASPAPRKTPSTWSRHSCSGRLRARARPARP
ncbi:MAG: hypothetical protein DMD48_00190 [Gemmatimonadetes bacterium]|nr:MAG: hypothetical protein DMD48_00190 [Gemmatimonadota bacterium]